METSKQSKVERDWTFQLIDRVGNKRYIYKDASGIHLTSADEMPLSLSYVSDDGALMRTKLLRASEMETAKNILLQMAVHASKVTEV